MKKKSPVPTPVQPRAVDSLPSRAQISQRAYELWIEDGRPENRELDHWLAAERQLGVTSNLHDDAGRLSIDPAAPADPAASDASRTDIEFERMVERPTRRSATSLG